MEVRGGIRLKVAVIGQKGIPSRAGGVEIHVEEIASRIADEGCEVTVYCRESYCNEKYDDYKGIKIKYIPSIHTKHLDAITYTALATFNAIKSDYDIIHYHALGPSLFAFLPRLFRKKVVCTVHGLDWKRQKWGLIGKLALKLGEFSTAYFPHKAIMVSQSLKKYYNEQYKSLDSIYIPNGIEEKNKKAINLIKDKYGLEKDEYILFLARLVPEKGVHYLIEAFQRIHPNKKLVIAGGSSHSDEYVEKLTDLAKGNPNIIFTGFIQGEILDELFTNAYCYVLPSDIEGLPISLIEAMAYGQCCLVSDIAENIEVIGSQGVSFKKGDIESLKQQLEYLIQNESVVNKYKQGAEKYIRERYNWDKVALETKQVYTSLM